MDGAKPNWLELPDDLMENILERVDTLTIFKGARKVCTAWRRICNDPAIWKVIIMYKPRGAGSDSDYALEMMTKQAIDFSCGELIDITIEGFGTDSLLGYILLRSSKLQRLCLHNCDQITGRGLSQAPAPGFPQLVSFSGNTQRKLCHFEFRHSNIAITGLQAIITDLLTWNH